MNAHAPPAVFDDSHHAATLLRKLCRALQLGPRYYLWDLPRYLTHRRSRGLPLWDGAAFTNPLREFRPRRTPPEELPPHYEEALALLAGAGVRLTIPRDRLEALLRLWWSARAAPGDVIECGSYRGATGLLLALLGRLNGVAQAVHLCDTFAGMPDTSGYDLGRRGGEFRPEGDQAAAIRGQAGALGVGARVELHQGLFSQTFPALEGRRLRFALVHIDANIYQGTLEACRFTLPRVAPGGVAVFDDYNGACDLGARLAIDEYLAGRGRPLPLTTTSAWMQF
jgi:O-methyltransferase